MIRLQQLDSLFYSLFHIFEQTIQESRESLDIKYFYAIKIKRALDLFYIIRGLYIYYIIYEIYSNYYLNLFYSQPKVRKSDLLL